MNPLLVSVRKLKSMMRRRGSSPEDAEDLVQEAFMRLHVYCSEGNEVRSPEAFLARTAINLAVDAYHREHAHLYASESPEQLELADSSPTPEDILAAEQRFRRIQELLDGASRRTRDVLFMHRLHGLSYAQIAEHFDISVSAIEKHIANAMAVLGPMMREELDRE